MYTLHVHVPVLCIPVADTRPRCCVYTLQIHAPVLRIHALVLRIHVADTRPGWGSSAVEGGARSRCRRAWGLSVFVAPEVFAECVLESGDDGQRRPGLASQQAADAALVDP